MKISLQLGLIPLDSNIDKVKWAKDNGAQGIEVGAGPLDQMKKNVDEMKGVLPVSSICGNTVNGEWTFDFLNPDKAKRRACLDGSKALLKFCGEVGGLGQIVPPIFGPPVVPDLSPFMDPIQLEDELCVAMLQELGPWAVQHKTMLFLEPLNRYEQHYLRKQADGVRLIEKAKTTGVALLSDFFHMHIEEENTPEAFRKAGKHVQAVHLADNTRHEPGTGDIDFVAGFKALRDINFKGYMAYECAISGATQKDKQKNLAKSLEYLRDCLKKSDGKSDAKPTAKK